MNRAQSGRWSTAPALTHATSLSHLHCSKPHLLLVCKSAASIYAAFSGIITWPCQLFGFLKACLCTWRCDGLILCTFAWKIKRGLFPGLRAALWVQFRVLTLNDFQMERWIRDSDQLRADVKILLPIQRDNIDKKQKNQYERAENLEKHQNKNVLPLSFLSFVIWTMHSSSSVKQYLHFSC